MTRRCTASHLPGTPTLLLWPEWLQSASSKAIAVALPIGSLTSHNRAVKESFQVVQLCVCVCLASVPLLLDKPCFSGSDNNDKYVHHFCRWEQNQCGEIFELGWPIYKCDKAFYDLGMSLHRRCLSDSGLASSWSSAKSHREEQQLPVIANDRTINTY